MTKDEKSKLVAEIAGKLVATQLDDDCSMQWLAEHGQRVVRDAVTVAKQIVGEAGL